MEGTNGHNDLCITCIHGDHCVRRKHHGKPVYFCEEFEYSKQIVKRDHSASQSGINSTHKDIDLEDSKGNALGLCANCSAKDTCTHPKPAGGVWHCEDYC